ncbi:hypothetical protein SARC_05284 [Sphaeroforma arctica JP610]|uniref:F-box domain-containing protein n=1 Tax=Sphaeroforma arctica JP610 TaxID=667725 RepID=A0A0L0G0Q6_9EUKA|nr:hypothetical protein SARC_05284 [Sphaeroforma arctica JP610]KNC82434.1 hypothetical protein SARC_05284 [Sphaeroforma arctica JP610]|eukprot:XP_014156336.1 hypothetical protein SARC_05284 [Sphaeroforma arctica JP610]
MMIIPLELFPLIASFCDINTLRALTESSKDIRRVTHKHDLWTLALERDRFSWCSYWFKPALLKYAYEHRESKVAILADIAYRHKKIPLGLLQRICDRIGEINMYEMLTYAIISMDNTFKKLMIVYEDILWSMSRREFEFFVPRIIEEGEGTGYYRIKAVLDAMNLHRIEVDNHAHTAYLYACCSFSKDSAEYLSSLDGYSELKGHEDYLTLCKLSSNYIESGSIVVLRSFCKRVVSWTNEFRLYDHTKTLIQDIIVHARNNKQYPHIECILDVLKNWTPPKETSGEMGVALLITAIEKYVKVEGQDNSEWYREKT